MKYNTIPETLMELDDEAEQLVEMLDHIEDPAVYNNLVNRYQLIRSKIEELTGAA